MCLLYKEFTPARRKVFSSSLSEKKSMTEMWTNPMFKELRAQIHEKRCCSTCWLEQISMISTTWQCCFYIRLLGDICFINFTYLHNIWTDTIDIKEFMVRILKFSSHRIFVSVFSTKRTVSSKEVYAPVSASKDARQEEWKALNICISKISEAK